MVSEVIYPRSNPCLPSPDQEHVRSVPLLENVASESPCAHDPSNPPDVGAPVVARALNVEAIPQIAKRKPIKFLREVIWMLFIRRAEFLLALTTCPDNLQRARS